MAKNKKKKFNKKAAPPKSNLQDLLVSRDGGQIALRGYSYQFLYSCYLILSANDKDSVITLEGIEDIDCVKYYDDQKSITHIQLKYSSGKQDASFMDSVLKNYLEAYLIDSNRRFKLVYDFAVAKGNLSKLFSGNLDDSSKKFWLDKIESIKEKNTSWKWDNFNFDDFVLRLSFENIKKDILEKQIEDSLIKNFDITIDNLLLYANGIKLLCLDKMENREEITYSDICCCIEKTKFNISQGVQNPAHSWIRRLDFSKIEGYSSDYYEGKKATPSDIANNLPIERPIVEKEIANSIEGNTITVIKTSSGQGKTTLALRVMSTLSEVYTPYQITMCNNEAELGFIVEYFRMRTRIGEKPLILIDNLDAHLSSWNLLAQLMQTSVTYHYKILVTSREIDWYNYSGDISNLHHLKIIKPALNEKEAEAIFTSLKKAGKLHKHISDWRKAWLQISDRQLLIEYVYLLTHGQMIAERISAQMKEIGNAEAGGIKFEILRKVCFADICGIKLETTALIKELNLKGDCDIGEVLRSLTNEFLVHISSGGNYIEGLHPVRSRHIVIHLHEYISLEETAFSVAKIASASDISILFSHYPEFDFNKDSFYSQIVDLWLPGHDLSRFVKAIRGTFSGSVMQYFQKHKSVFDDVYEHGGLMLVATDLCPFTKFEDCERESDTLDKIAEITPDNANIQYLIKKRDSISKFRTANTDIYCLCSALYLKLKLIQFERITDLESYAIIVDWLYNIDPSMNLTTCVSLQHLWKNIENCSLETVSLLMYSVFCGDKDSYKAFVDNNLQKILTYLKHKTNSHKIQVSDSGEKIKVEYILRASEVTQGNNESVSRLTHICRTLPIFEVYCSDAIKPKLDILESYQIPNDTHKEMPTRNIIITFHQEFNGLWLKTIESNYEFDSIYAWNEYWLNVRKCAYDLLNISCKCMCRLLEMKKLNDIANSFDVLRQRYNNMMLAYLSYPREHRPFEDKPNVPELFNKAKRGYFDGIQNFANQLVGFIKREDQSQRLATHNLKTSLAALENIQKFFDDIISDKEQYKTHKELCGNEEKMLNEAYMCCEYYLSHTPNSRFNKFQINKWFSSRQKADIDKLNGSMMELKNSYEVVFPKRTYLENIFSCYPVILKNIDLTNESVMGDFLINAISFAESPYDYLLLLATNTMGEVIPTAIKFSKKAFQYIYDEINSGKQKEMDPMLSPYPVEVSSKMLACFDETFTIQNQYPQNLWLSKIADIGEELWVYSKNRQLLFEEKDRQYLNDNLSTIKKSIDEMITSIEKSANEEELSFIKELCSDVYSGEVFDDNEYNELISHIQSITA